MKKLEYHSALHPQSATDTEADRVIIGESIAMFNDITQYPLLPVEYQKCDVLYTELSWVAGLSVFNERAKRGVPYKYYIDALNRIISSFRTPIFIVAGKKDCKLLPKPELFLLTKLNGAPAQENIYNTLYWGEHNTTTDIINQLAEDFECVGDFCCGYGNTGNIFREHGKQFVMSDYNKQCIGYIKSWLC